MTLLKPGKVFSLFFQIVSLDYRDRYLKDILRLKTLCLQLSRCTVVLHLFFSLCYLFQKRSWKFRKQKTRWCMKILYLLLIKSFKYNPWNRCEEERKWNLTFTSLVAMSAHNKPLWACFYVNWIENIDIPWLCFSGWFSTHIWSFSVIPVCHVCVHWKKTPSLSGCSIHDHSWMAPLCLWPALSHFLSWSSWLVSLVVLG